MNKWLVIIVILFICFIIIPILLKLFNMKEGFSINDVGNKVNDVKDKLNVANNNINIIKSAQPADKEFIKQRIDSAAQGIKNNDEENERAILDAIKNSPNQPNNQLNISSQMSNYNTQLTRYNTQLTSIFSGLGDPNQGLLKKLNDMNANISAYNTTNLSNTGAISTMDSTIQSTNTSYLSNITEINEKLKIIKEQIDKTDYEEISKKIEDYTTKQLYLTESILTNIASNKAEDDAFKVKLRERLKMDKMKE
jgi:hypothetical protein